MLQGSTYMGNYTQGITNKNNQLLRHKESTRRKYNFKAPPKNINM